MVNGVADDQAPSTNDALDPEEHDAGRSSTSTAWWRGFSRGHDHAHDGAHHDVTVDPEWARVLWQIVIVSAVLTVVGILLLWPGHRGGFEDPLQLDAEPINAKVVAAELQPCSVSPLDSCSLASFELSGYPYDGEIGKIEEALPGRLDVGDKIRVTFFETDTGERIFSLYDYQRNTPMMVLFVLFVASVVLLGRWRGLGALAGLGMSLLVIVWFTLPAILDGSNAVMVAVVTASLIAFIALFLAHGFDHATAVALVATLASLLLTALLAWLFVGATQLTGFTDDSNFLLAGLSTGIDPRGILLAGIVIGSLGVLDDVTVTQVSAVWQLKSVQPELSTRELVRPALHIGRDHISSTVNTLFLAYAGTSLALLLLFVQANQSLTEVVTREIVATEVVRALVGSIGLVASVPISTWLAAAVLTTPQTEG
jgi:uncharacterized membrane protein